MATYYRLSLQWDGESSVIGMWHEKNPSPIISGYAVINAKFRKGVETSSIFMTEHRGNCSLYPGE